jgi:hypothetical protein
VLKHWAIFTAISFAQAVSNNRMITTSRPAPSVPAMEKLTTATKKPVSRTETTVSALDSVESIMKSTDSMLDLTDSVI